jgi:hypothetical protein
MPSSTRCSVWQFQRRSATGLERARSTRTSATHIIRRGTLRRPLSATHSAVPVDCKGGGRPDGGGRGIREPRACDNLQGNYVKAIECHAQDLAIAAKEVGDRSEEGQGYANLGPGHMYLNECDTTVTYHTPLRLWSLLLRRQEHTRSAHWCGCLGGWGCVCVCVWGGGRGILGACREELQQ